MPEEPIAADGGEKQPIAGENNEPGAADKNASNPTGKEGAGKGDQGGNGEKDPTKADQQPKPPIDPKPGDDDDKAEPLVKSRMSTKDFIIQRQQKKIADLKAGDNKGGEGGDSGDDDVNPEDEAMINKVVAKNFAPIIDKTIAADDEKEIGSFLAENPDFKPYETKVRRFMQHPSRRQLPIESIFYEVAGPALIKLGAERQKSADEKAKNTQTGGGSNRGGEGGKTIADLSEEEFAAKQDKVRRGEA